MAALQKGLGGGQNVNFGPAECADALVNDVYFQGWGSLCVGVGWGRVNMAATLALPCVGREWVSP